MGRKVIQIVRSPAGGIRKHILSIVEGLGEEIEMFLITDCSEADKKYIDFISSTNSKCLKVFNLKILDQPGFRDLLNIYKILQIVKLISPNVLHGHGAKGGLYARVVGFLLGVKVIYTAHGGSIHDMHGKIKNRIYSIVERVLYEFSDLLVFESSYTLEQYSKKIGRSAKDQKFRLNYNAIDFPSDLSEIKCKEIEEKSEIIIGAFGLLRKIKGHDLLIDAVKVLRDKGHAVTLKLYGDGEERENLLNKAKYLHIENFVEIFSEVECVDKAMRNCHIIAHPSRFESFGYVPLEALVNGVTVVSSLTGGLKEVMDEGRSGFCFEEVTSHEVAKQIECAILNQNLRERKHQHGLEFLSKNFSIDRFMKNIRKYYME